MLHVLLNLTLKHISLSTKYAKHLILICKHYMHEITLKWFSLEACEDWHFGTNCNEMCNCLTISCNALTGKCPDGDCAKGWSGDSCDQGKHTQYLMLFVIFVILLLQWLISSPLNIKNTRHLADLLPQSYESDTTHEHAGTKEKKPI